MGREEPPGKLQGVGYPQKRMCRWFQGGLVSHGAEMSEGQEAQHEQKLKGTLFAGVKMYSF